MRVAHVPGRRASRRQPEVSADGVRIGEGQGVSGHERRRVRHCILRVPDVQISAVEGGVLDGDERLMSPEYSRRDADVGRASVLVGGEHLCPLADRRAVAISDHRALDLMDEALGDHGRSQRRSPDASCQR